MKPTLFISDLHLCAERPETNRRFFRFLRETAPGGAALYILGDLFEYWVGDDDRSDPVNAEITSALASLSRQGVALYFLHGNRDFLVGEDWARDCGATLLPETHRVELYGTPTLLMHGDTLCLDDVKYQAFRAQVRSPGYQRQFLARPLAERKALVEKLRADSEQEKQGKSAEIMDVRLSAVDDELRRHGYPRLIHGHTHRPARHLHTVDGHRCERWVLSDWYRGGEYLRVDAGGCTPVAVEP